MNKRLLLSLMAVCYNLSYASTIKVGQIYYNLLENKGVAEVTYSNTDPYDEQTYTIPESILYDEKKYTVTAIGEKAFYKNADLTDIFLPNTITTIDRSAFYGCKELWTVKVGNSLKNIGNYAFYGCSKLNPIELPETLETIGDYAFSSCHFGDNSAYDFVLPNSLTTLGKSTFAYSNMNSINIPSTVTKIGTGCFEGCDIYGVVRITDLEAWMNLYFESPTSNPLTSSHRLYLNEEPIINLMIPNTVTKLRDYCFYGAETIQTITMHDEVEWGGNKAFMNCKRLMTVVIGNGLQKINTSMFEGCTLLESVWIGSSINTIDAGAFANCKNLTDIYCTAESAPTIYTYSTSPFSNAYINLCTLHVPETSMSSYNSMTPWNEFKQIVSVENGAPFVPEQCAAPTLSWKGGKPVIESSTAGSTCHFIMKCDIENGTGIESLEIIAYSTANGYLNSKNVTIHLSDLMGTPGDMDNNGKLTVADISELVNRILSQEIK